jgi:hypothetical protein
MATSSAMRHYQIMTIFAVVAHQKSDLLKAEVELKYPGQFYFLAPNTWFILDNITTAEVGAKLRIVKGELGAQAVVMPVSGWTGYAPADLWEWLKSRLEVRSNG